jgi:hypothetical protein
MARYQMALAQLRGRVRTYRAPRPRPIRRVHVGGRRRPGARRTSRAHSPPDGDPDDPEPGEPSAGHLLASFIAATPGRSRVCAAPCQACLPGGGGERIGVGDAGRIGPVRA